MSVGLQRGKHDTLEIRQRDTEMGAASYGCGDDGRGRRRSAYL